MGACQSPLKCPTPSGSPSQACGSPACQQPWGKKCRVSWGLCPPDDLLSGAKARPPWLCGQPISSWAAQSHFVDRVEGFHASVP